MVQTGRATLTMVDEATEIYRNGRFLELDILTQVCALVCVFVCVFLVGVCGIILLVIMLATIT